jgi:hypothetical protein
MTEDAAPAQADQVLVRNTSGRMLTLILTGKHLAAAAPGSPHRYKPVKLVTVHHAKSGALAMRVRKTLMADALRIPVGPDVRVDRAATYCAEFRKAIANKKIRVMADPAPPAPPPAKREPTWAEQKAAEAASKTAAK